MRYAIDTPSSRQRLLDALRIGSHLSTAVRAAGMSLPRVKAIFEIGKKARGNNPSAIFYRQCLEAMGEAEVHDITTMAQHSATDWKATAWRLERRYPDRWGNYHHHHQSNVNVTIGEQRTLVANLTLDQLRRIEAIQLEAKLLQAGEIITGSEKQMEQAEASEEEEEQSVEPRNEEENC